MSSQRNGYTFSQVPTNKHPRSSFNRSSTHKMTFNEGLLYPFFVDEALPGDTFNLRTQGFCRMSTPIYPIMDNMYMDTFYFAVPMRLVWDNWERFMGAQDNPGDPTDYLIPQMLPPAGGYVELGLHDYFGLPTKQEQITHSALPLRAYNLIWNEWFRDQNLQDSLPVPKGDGPDDPSQVALFAQNRGKRHDYFTAALPFPQKGGPVEINIGGNADVTGIIDDQARGDIFQQFVGGAFTATNVNVVANDVSLSSETLAGPAVEPLGIDFSAARAIGISGTADLSTATPITINALREAFQIQKMYEKDARGGTRYVEMIKSHFNVVSPDFRLQRPEFLGGGSTMININPIYSTTDLTAVGGTQGGEIGRLSAVVTAGVHGHGFVKSFTEHCIIIGLVNVRADITYQQGLNRMWSRQERHDHYFPSFAFLGEQEILNKEIFAGADPVQNEAVFGYQERWAEYRYKPSTVTGAFRSNYTTPLDAWHLAEDFQDYPALNAQFIRDTPPLNRVVAAPSEPRFIGDFYHKLICARPMPLFGVPGNIDRF